MSSSLLRVIEVKVRGEWRILDIPTLQNEHFSYEKDDYVESEKFNNDFYLHYVSEASLILRDNVFGFGAEDNYMKNRPFPKDISEEVKKILPESRVYCVNLEDWPLYIKAEKEKFEKEVENYYNKKNSALINLKLDSILQGFNYEQTQNIIKSKDAEELPDDEDLLYMKDYIWSELYYNLIAINNEYDSIYNLIYDIYNDWPETRIYYWID